MNTHQVAVKAIIEREDFNLLLRRSPKDAPNRYKNLTHALDIPGGRLKCLEGLEEGLEREVAEETGLRIKEIHYLLEIKTVFRNSTSHILRITYICSVYDGVVQISPEHIEAHWFRREQLPNLSYKDHMLKETILRYCTFRST